MDKTKFKLPIDTFKQTDSIFKFWFNECLNKDGEHAPDTLQIKEMSY